MSRRNNHPSPGAKASPKIAATFLALAWGTLIPACKPDESAEGARVTAASAVGPPVAPTVGSTGKEAPRPGDQAASGTTARPVPAEVAPVESATAQTGRDGILPSPGAAMAKAQAPLPQGGKEQAQALADRIDRVGSAINTACGTEIRILLNETGRGGMATGEGVVYVDFSMVWRLSEDALAVLVAHEFAHEVLGHAEQLNRLHYEGTGNPSYVQQVRGLEKQADQYAGRILARTDYDPVAFKELLALGHDTEWADPLLRSYYPNRDRIKTVMESYQAERAGQGKPDVSPAQRED